MKNLNLLYLTMLFLVFPDFANCSTVDQNQGLSKKYPYSFSARDYFSPRYDGAFVSPDWPNRVNFKPIKKSIEQFKLLLSGKWRMMFTCSGRPLSPDENLDMYPYIMDGYYKDFVIYDFNQGALTRYFSASISRLQRNAKASDIKDRSATVQIDEDTMNPFVVYLIDLQTEHYVFTPESYEVFLLQETGEEVLSFQMLTATAEEHINECPGGEEFYIILTREDAPSV